MAHHGHSSCGDTRGDDDICSQLKAKASLTFEFIQGEQFRFTQILIKK